MMVESFNLIGSIVRDMGSGCSLFLRDQSNFTGPKNVYMQFIFLGLKRVVVKNTSIVKLVFLRCLLYKCVE